MFQIAATPEPPYYAVIAPTELRDDVTGYGETAVKLAEIARGIDGFLGIESAVSGRFVIAVSYWRSLEAIQAWRRHAEHLAAKELGRTRWFEKYVTRIAKVERVY
jgi:heme-degrading monooxygenase HmoA